MRAEECDGLLASFIAVERDFIRRELDIRNGGSTRLRHEIVM
jgi:hypothetical protein